MKFKSFILSLLLAMQVESAELTSFKAGDTVKADDFNNNFSAINSQGELNKTNIESLTTEGQQHSADIENLTDELASVKQIQELSSPFPEMLDIDGNSIGFLVEKVDTELLYTLLMEYKGSYYQTQEEGVTLEFYLDSGCTGSQYMPVGDLPLSYKKGETVVMYKIRTAEYISVRKDAQRLEANSGVYIILTNKFSGVADTCTYMDYDSIPEEMRNLVELSVFSGELPASLITTNDNALTLNNGVFYK